MFFRARSSIFLNLSPKREVFWSFLSALPPTSQNSKYTWKKLHPETACPFSVSSGLCCVPVSPVTTRKCIHLRDCITLQAKSPLQTGKSRSMMHLNYYKMKMRYHSSTYIQNKEHHVVKSHFSVSLDNLASVSEHSGVINYQVQVNYHQWQLMGIMWCYSESTKTCCHTWGNFKEMFPWFIRIRWQLIHLTPLQ